MLGLVVCVFTSTSETFEKQLWSPQNYINSSTTIVCSNMYFLQPRIYVLYLLVYVRLIFTSAFGFGL